MTKNSVTMPKQSNNAPFTHQRSSTPNSLIQGKELAHVVPLNVFGTVMLMEEGSWILLPNSAELSHFVIGTFSAILALTPDNLESMYRMKDSLVLYNDSLNNVIHKYTHRSVNYSFLPSLEEIQREKQKIEHIISEMTPQGLLELTPKAASYPDQILCDILGVERGCAEWMQDMAFRYPETRHHQTDEYWVHQYLENRAALATDSSFPIDFGTDLIYEDDDMESEELMVKLKDAFICLGFSENRAKLLATWLNENPYRRHQSLLYWAHCHVDNVFNSHILLTECQRYPYHKGTTGVWGDVPIPGKNRTGDEQLPGNIHVKVYNFDSKKKIPISIPQDQTEYPPQNDKKHEYWYHGTRHDCAKEIIENGIDVQKGNPKQDFSDNGGFYLSPTMEGALRWACYKGQPGAVIVFKISKQCLERDFRGLDLSADREHWKKIVDFCRQGKRKDLLDSRERKGYLRAPYVVGSISMERKKGVSGWTKGAKEQICIKCPEMAECVGDVRNIDSVVFYDNQQL